MSSQVSIVDPATGQVLVSALSISAVEDVQAQVAPTGPFPGAIVVEGHHPAGEVYFPEGIAVPRPKLADDVYEITADGTDNVLLPLPATTRVVFQGSLTIADGEPLEFLTSVPGTYEFHLRPPFPYQSQVVKVVANAV